MICPICARETTAAYKPFCSKRCADVDLGRWLTGGYVLPAQAIDDENPADPAADSSRPSGPQSGPRQ